MKKIIEGFVLVAVALVCVFPATTSASFSLTLAPGTLNSPEVIELQKFLSMRGFFNEEASGNYLSLTRAAVAKFQTSVGIDATGYFGPLTVAATNAMLKGQTVAFNNSAAQISPLSSPSAQVSALILTEAKKGMTASAFNAFVQDTKTLSWHTANYPLGVGIDIHLLKKVSESPVQFEFVQMIATNTPNDGIHTWPVPSGGKQDNLYVEIACSDSYEFAGGCGVGGAPIKY